MVEMALGWFVVTTAFTSAFEYGYIFYQYNSLFNAINNGARYASMYPYDVNSSDYTTSATSQFQTAVQDMVLYGDPTGASTTLVLKNLKSTNLVITVSPTGSGATWTPASITVSIGTDTNGYTIDGLFGSFIFKGKPTVTYPFVGNYTGAQ